MAKRGEEPAMTTRFANAAGPHASLEGIKVIGSDTNDDREGLSQ
jgi:hypothetical protein